MRLTSNALVGLTRNHALVERFPWLKSLTQSWRLYSNSAQCSACGQKASHQQFGNAVNEALKIAATITEDEMDEFKKMTGQKSFQITYVDIRGQRQTVVR